MLSLCVAMAVLTPPASAQRGVDLALIRSTSPGVPADLADAVDARLTLALAEAGGVRNVLVSPVAYAEVQLAVGCSDESVACLTSIVETANVAAILVRHLSADASGSVQLQTLYFEPAADRPPARTQTSGSLDRQAELVASVPNLVRTLLGGSANEHAERSSYAEGTAIARGAPNEPPAVTTPTWITLAGGALLLVPGIALAVSAESDYDAFRRQPIATRADVDRARDDFSSIETRAAWSSVLIPAGAIALGVGAVLLGIDLTAGGEPDSDSADRVFIAPLDRGGMLGVRGSLDRMR
jgi:hypothetical protein